MVASTSVLLVVAALGLWFPNTRGISLACVGLLVYLHQWLAVPILIACAVALYIFRINK